MKSLVSLTFLLAAVLAAPIQDGFEDQSCLMEWVTVYGDASAPAASSKPAPSVPNSKVLPDNHGKSGQASSGGQTGTSSADSPSASLPGPSVVPLTSPTSGIAATTNPEGEPGFPVDGSHLSAPTATDPVPAGAAIFKPLSTHLSGKAFAAWVDEQKQAKLASKWLKIAPGTYTLALDDGITFGFTPGGWTFDMREVTLLVPTPNPDATSGQAIYINQSEDLTILGGTVWFDQGEQWSQAKVTSIVPIADGKYTATFEVEAGYQTSVWKTAGPRNQGCVDTSDPNHYTRPGCNFWFPDQYDFSNLESKRTFTSRIVDNAQIKVGYTITMMITGANSRTTIASEFNGNLHVNGMTSNGGLAQYGLTGGKTTAIFENVWNVNPPARPGFAPRVQGPTLSQAHIGLFDFDAGGDAPIIYKNCHWQTTGSTKDLQDMNDQELH